ncbi:UDP-glycosyltransferase 79B30 [Glycine soja]
MLVLLLGFELTRMSFLAALKPPIGAEAIESALPEGFNERTNGRGVNSALKGLDDAPQPKSKAAARWIICNRQKGSTECDYYYFNDPRPLELERLKTLRIQWA